MTGMIPRNLLLLVLFCVFGVLLLSACTTRTAPQPVPETTVVEQTIVTPVPKQVNITVASLTRLYRVEGGCYYRAQIDITNTGDTPVTNLAVRLMLCDSSTGAVPDSENIFLERISAHETKVFTRDFDGNCSAAYGIHADVT